MGPHLALRMARPRCHFAGRPGSGSPRAGAIETVLTVFPESLPRNRWGAGIWRRIGALFDGVSQLVADLIQIEDLMPSDPRIRRAMEQAADAAAKVANLDQALLALT